MTDAPRLAFDTGPLRHFALSGWLGALHFITMDRYVVIPESVERELSDQRAEFPSLAQVFDGEWIHIERHDDIPYLSAFADYADRLVSGTKNRGECGVLALGKAYGDELVLDDATARQIASEEHLQVTTTLDLLCAAIREQKLTVTTVEQLADDLLQGDYYFPFGRGAFRMFAVEMGLIDYQQG